MDNRTAAAKHYPGPWRLEGNFDAEVDVAIFSGEGEQELLVAEFEPFCEDWSEEEIANVRLMLAAPELLRELKAILTIADDEVQRPGDNEQRFRALKRIRNLLRESKVIANAEGRA